MFATYGLFKKKISKTFNSHSQDMWNLGEVDPDMAAYRLSLQATVTPFPGPNKELLMPSVENGNYLVLMLWSSVLQ